MATPRVKRAFAGSASDPAQRHITSFFARDETTAAHSQQPSRSPSSHDAANTPLLPPSVQANLLAVGMRVRKSVPEGYKTGKDIEKRMPQPKSSSSLSYSTGCPATALQQRELLPFCGLNRVGGLGVQAYDEHDAVLNADADADASDDDDDEPPALTSSQETVSSASSFLSGPPRHVSNKKRFFYDDVDGEKEDVDDAAYSRRFHVPRPTPAVSFSAASSINAWLIDGQVSPHTQTPPPPIDARGRRVLAVPRRRQQQSRSDSPKVAEGQLPPGGIFEQENAGDFADAHFLDANLLSDMEMEGM